MTGDQDVSSRVSEYIRKTKKDGLDLLREPFPPNQISKLPKGTKKQNECPASEKINCKVCGGWHHPQVIHLDYVGHAALTDRLLDADPSWDWQPLAFTEQGLPAFDQSGGLWIRLTVCGQTRLGYGHAQSASFKEIGSREKEVIGDALRNAAMRFGAALDLWHKGDLHGDNDDEEKPDTKPEPIQADEFVPQDLRNNDGTVSRTKVKAWESEFYREIHSCTDMDQYGILVEQNKPAIQTLQTYFPQRWHGSGDIPGLKEEMMKVTDGIKHPQAAE